MLKTVHIGKVVAATAVCLSLLASCAQGDPQVSESSVAGPVELNMLVSAGSSGEALTAAAERWAGNTGNKFNVTSMPYGDVRQQEVLALSTNSDSLDVMPCGPDWFTSMLGAGNGLVNLGELAERDGYSFDHIMPGVLNAYNINGAQYALPVRAAFYILAYRADLLQEAGFTEPPKTWDEFDTMAKALTIPEKNQYGAGITMAQVSITVEPWQAVVLNHGGTFAAADGTLTLDSAPVVEATQRIADWYKNGLVPPDSLQYTDTELIAAMQQGRIAMGVVSNAWLVRVIDPEASDFADQWKVAPRMPSGANGNGQTMIAGWGLCLNPNSKHIDQAWDFIKFAASDETQLWLALDKFNEPITSATYEDSTYLAARPQAPNILSSASDGRPGSEPFTGWADVQMGLQAVVSGIYAGDSTAAEGLAAANKELQKFIQP